MHTTLDLLNMLDLGNSVAEFDNNLSDFFVETQLFKDFHDDKYDVVKGEKGTGKSAIYRVLRENKQPLLIDSNLSIVPAFNESGAPVFRRLIEAETNDENRFRAIWKLYIFAVAGNAWVDKLKKTQPKEAKNIEEKLISLKLREKDNSTLIGIWNTMVSMLHGAKIQIKGGGLKGTFKMGKAIADLGKFEETADHLLAELNQSVNKKGERLWILFDRLDESFSDNPEKELAVMRGLCRAYLDCQSLTDIKIKLFFRGDLFRRIALGGFVNLTHLQAKSRDITWYQDDLFSLICTRIRKSNDLMSYLKVDRRTNDKTLFSKVFPKQVDTGSRKPTTWNWMLSRIRDGNGLTPPRNIIDLINKAKEAEIEKLQREVRNNQHRGPLISSESIKRGLEGLSVMRVTDTLLADSDADRELIESFRGTKTEHNKKSLGKLLNLKGDELNIAVKSLKQVGFLEERGTSFKIPMLFRAGLEMIQGRAY